MIHIVNDLLKSNDLIISDVARTEEVENFTRTVVISVSKTLIPNNYIVKSTNDVIYDAKIMVLVQQMASRTIFCRIFDHVPELISALESKFQVSTTS